MSHRHRVSIFLSTLLFGSMTQAAVFAAGDDLSNGLEEFSYRRYRAASGLLEKAITVDPTNFKAHFTLAQCFEYLQEYQAASDEYEYAMRLNPFSSEGQVAKQSMMRLSGKLEAKKHPADDPRYYGQALNQINNETPAGASAGANGSAFQSFNNSKRPSRSLGLSYQAPPSGPTVVVGSSTSSSGNYAASQRQARRRNTQFGYTPPPTASLSSPTVTTYYGAGGYGGGTAALGGGAASGGAYSPPAYTPPSYTPPGGMQGGSNVGKYSAPSGNGYNPITQYTNQFANQNSQYGAMGNGGGSYPNNSRNSRSRYQQPTNINVNQGQQSDSVVQQLRAQQASAQYQLELQNSANSLKQLLATPKRAGEAKLRAIGTNLYVRNYSESDDGPPPEDPAPPELRARAGSLTGLTPSPSTTTTR